MVLRMGKNNSTNFDGTDLRRWRERHGMMQEELANILGVHFQTISKWECDRRKVPKMVKVALEGIEKTKSAA